jgi:hypothetical protein
LSLVDDVLVETDAVGISPIEVNPNTVTHCKQTKTAMEKSKNDLIVVVVASKLGTVEVDKQFTVVLNNTLKMDYCAEKGDSIRSTRFRFSVDERVDVIERY